MKKRKLMVVGVTLFFAGMINLQGQVVGEAAPDFEVGLLGSGTFKLSEQAGKVVFVFLFGNGCPPCKAVAPSIEANIYQQFKDNPAFKAIGLDTWNSSSSETSVTGFKGMTGVTFPLALMAGSVASVYGTTYDRMMVIDQNGILVFKGTSGAKNDLENVVAAIHQSLAVTGLENVDTDRSTVRVFPMPATDVVYFESEESIRELRMYDVSGKLVMEESYGPGTGTYQRTVSLENLGKGLYFYTLKTEGSTRSGKLLIQQ